MVKYEHSVHKGSVFSSKGKCKCGCIYLDALDKSLFPKSVMKSDFVVRKLMNSLNKKTLVIIKPFIIDNILTDWHFSVLVFRCVSSPNLLMVPTQQALRWRAWRFRWWRWTKMATLTWHTSRLWWELICIPLGFVLQQHVTTKVITGQQNLTDAGWGTCQYWICCSSDPVYKRCCSLPGGQTQG